MAQKVIHMNSGIGELSYAKNSKIQCAILSMTMTVRQRAAMELYCTTLSGCLSIAELGCASGPNALRVASEAMEAIERKCSELHRAPPEFRLLLNDLPSNDFNTIFRSLPEFYQHRSGRRATDDHHERGRCFVSRVPGSFYGRLFSSKSLHLVHSSSSLHWLSQVPLGLEDGSSMNKGKIYISETSPPGVCDAYLEQFEGDFSLFLKRRGEEIVEGGRMVLALMGRRSLDHPSVMEYSYHWELLAEALMAMASEGIIKKERVDTFNAPYYTPSPKEVENVVQREGSLTIQSLEMFEANWDDIDENDQDLHHEGSEIETYIVPPQMIMSNGELWTEEMINADRVAKGIRAVVERMLESHFGEHIIEDLFARYTSLLKGYFSENQAVAINMVIAMVRT